jgi:hypothetical protein
LGKVFGLKGVKERLVCLITEKRLRLSDWRGIRGNESTRASLTACAGRRAKGKGHG